MYCKCKGICKTAKFINEYKTTTKNKNSFKLGYFRCRRCEYYIKGFNNCPCCGTKLAQVPRNAKSKRLLNIDVGRY